MEKRRMYKKHSKAFMAEEFVMASEGEVSQAAKEGQGEIECGCGGRLNLGDENCSNCTKPFQLSGWKKTKIRLERITIDTTCINVKQENHALNLLENWAEQGHIKIQRADALMKELKGSERIEKAARIPGHPGLFTLGASTLGGGDVLAGPDLTEPLKQILFPSVKSLTPNQEMDVRHLQQHVRTGGDCFVTLNTKDFIDGGKAEKLHSQYGVWVFTPDQVVALLGELYGISDLYTERVNEMREEHRRQPQERG